MICLRRPLISSRVDEYLVELRLPDDAAQSGLGALGAAEVEVLDLEDRLVGIDDPVRCAGLVAEQGEQGAYPRARPSS